MATRRGDAIRQAALEKLALLKAKLKYLMLVGGDPATRARQAAEIAKEIGRTAREYASAGGGSAGAAANAASVAGSGGATVDPGTEASGAAAVQSDPSATAVSATTPEGSQGGSADVAANAASVDSSAGATAIPSPEAAGAAAIQSGISAATAALATTPVDRQTGSAAPADASATTASNASPAPAGSSGTSGRVATSNNSMDREFIQVARLLARPAKAILQGAMQQASSQKQKTSTSGAEGDKALAAIDDAASALGLGSNIPVDTGAVYDASARPAAAAPVAAVTVSA